MRIIDNQESCVRFARAICSDLMLYNEKDVAQVKRGQPMSATLLEAIQEGRTLYLSRTTPAFSRIFDDTLGGFVGINPNMEVDTMKSPVPTDYKKSESSEYQMRSTKDEKGTFPTVFILLVAAIFAGCAIYFWVIR